MVARALRSAAVSFLLAGFSTALLLFALMFLGALWFSFASPDGGQIGWDSIAGRDLILLVFAIAWASAFFIVHRRMGRTLPPRIE